MDLRRKTRSSTNSSSGPPLKLGVASTSHTIKKNNLQQKPVFKSRKPVLEKWMVSSPTKSISKEILKMKDKCIICDEEPKVGQIVDVVSKGKIDKGRVIKGCPVGYLIHYEGWSVMFDEWIKTVKSKKEVFVTKIVPNVGSGKKSKSHLTNGAKDIKILEIEDDNENGGSVKSITRNNNSPLAIAKSQGRPSKYRSQILQTPVSKLSSNCEVDGALKNEIGVRTRNQGVDGNLKEIGVRTRNKEVDGALKNEIGVRTRNQEVDGALKNEIGVRTRNQEVDGNLKNEIGVRTRNQEKVADEKEGWSLNDKDQPQKTNREKSDSLSQTRAQWKRELQQETNVTDMLSSPKQKTRNQDEFPTPRKGSQGKVQTTQTGSQGKVSMPHDGSQGKVPTSQAEKHGKVPVSQIGKLGKVPVPQSGKQGKVPIPQIGNQDKRETKDQSSNFMVQESQNLVSNSSKEHGAIHRQEKQVIVTQPKYSGSHVPSFTMTGSNHKFTGPHINGGVKTKENFWITNKDLGDKSVFKNEKSEKFVSENGVGFTNMSSFSGNSGKQSSFSFNQGRQDQSKASSSPSTFMPFVFNKTQQFEMVDWTEEDEDDSDLMCTASTSCMAAFWYRSELMDHLSTAHGIQDPYKFCIIQEKKSNEINKKKEKENHQEESYGTVNKTGDVTIDLISPVKPVVKSNIIPFTKVVSPNKTLSQYEQIRENNIKERQEMFVKLGIQESKKDLTPARRTSRTPNNKKKTPRLKTPSDKSASGSIRKSSRLMSKPEMNYSIMDKDSSDNEAQDLSDNEDNEAQSSHSDTDEDVWVQKKVKPNKKKLSKFWVLKDTPQETNNDKKQEDAIHNSNSKSAKIQDDLEHVNDMKDLIASVETKQVFPQGYDSGSDDGGFYCSVQGCMQSFWYQNQLFEHMAYTHD